MMFDNLSRRERIMISVLVIIALGAAAYYFAYMPLMERRESLEDQIFNKEGQVDNYKKIISNMDELEEQYSDLQYIEDRIVNRRIYSVEDLLAFLENESTNSGIKITSYVPSVIQDSSTRDNEENNNQSSRTRVNMTAEGTYDELVLFLKGLDKLNWQLEFDNLSIYPQDDNNSLLEMDAVFIYNEDLFIGGGQT
ncbi:MAG: type 4a pilus biogenesis protein PilO [Halanaerobiaceae bacterium]